MISKQKLAFLTEEDMESESLLCTILDHILRAYFDGKCFIEEFIPDDVLDLVKLELVSNGYVVRCVNDADLYEISWYA